MEDVQSRHDAREIPLEQVGVSELRYPITVLDREADRQQTIATVELSVNLPHHFKGTHMSRFIEVLEAHRGEVTMFTMPALVEDLRERLEAERARVCMRFTYFVERAAPASGARSLLDVEARFIGESGESGDELFELGVRTPVTSLCPCSKAISDYGAHNQRGFVDIACTFTPDAQGERQMIWIEELIEIAERSASAPIYALLKREDERHVTMQAYDNPVFVEDMARAAAVALRADARVASYRISAENDESIHNHKAFARTSWRRP
ncbi:MAG: GTP cyclohydrolase I FolE2 [Myxococcales bacterium]|nr:GTP cyclohydrolase I FolE2 [Myxococcales bacterium]